MKEDEIFDLLKVPDEIIIQTLRDELQRLKLHIASQDVQIQSDKKSEKLKQMGVILEENQKIIADLKQKLKTQNQEWSAKYDNLKQEWSAKYSRLLRMNEVLSNQLISHAREQIQSE